MRDPLLERWRSHNFCALLGALLSLAGAAAAWVFLYYFGQWAALGFLSSVHGHEAELPGRYPFWFAAAVCAAMCAALFLRWVFPKSPAGDRPILGWHLVPELLVLPASLTLSFTDFLASYRKVTPRGLDVARRVLAEILLRKKVWEGDRGWRQGIAAEDAEIEEALRILEGIGWVDRHRNKPRWSFSPDGKNRIYYRVRSTAEQQAAAASFPLGEAGL